MVPSQDFVYMGGRFQTRKGISLLLTISAPLLEHSLPAGPPFRPGPVLALPSRNPGFAGEALSLGSSSHPPDSFLPATPICSMGSSCCNWHPSMQRPIWPFVGGYGLGMWR